MSSLFKIFASNIDMLTVGQRVKDIAIAVSGGGDSIALLHLLVEWGKGKGLNILVLTVNHNLRLEALEECEYVYKIAKILGLKCIILNWNPPILESNLQARARQGRYDLMTKACEENNINLLLTAHHLDDYNENLIIRYQRGCSIFGLSSSKYHFINNIKVIRPLYNIAKSDLIDYLNFYNIKWVEDPSNFSNKYLRNQIRNTLVKDNLEFNEEYNIIQQEINNEVKNLQKILIKAVAECCAIYNYGFCIINLSKLILFDNQIQFQLISYILNIVGGKDYGARGRVMKLLLNLLETNNDFIKTMHNCTVKRFRENLLIYRHFGREYPLSFNIGDKHIWDNRFKIQINSEIKSYDLIVTYLNNKDYKEIFPLIKINEISHLSLKNHKQILFTLPVIKKLEKIIAIPHISFYNDKNLVGKIKFLYHPKFISRFIHFI